MAMKNLLISLLLLFPSTQLLARDPTTAVVWTDNHRCLMLLDNHIYLIPEIHHLDTCHCDNSHKEVFYFPLDTTQFEE